MANLQNQNYISVLIAKCACSRLIKIKDMIPLTLFILFILRTKSF